MVSSSLSPIDPADAALARRVSAFLASRHVPSLRRLIVESRGGRVTLRGKVRSFYEKQLGQQTARRVAGVTHLTDAVEVVHQVVRPAHGAGRLALAPAAADYLRRLRPVASTAEEDRA